MYKKILKMLIIVFTCFCIYKIFDKVKVFNSNESFIIDMLKNSNYYTKYDNKKLFSTFINRLYNINIKEPLSIIKTTIYNKGFNDEEYDIEKLSKTTKHIEILIHLK